MTKDDPKTKREPKLDSTPLPTRILSRRLSPAAAEAAARAAKAPRLTADDATRGAAQSEALVERAADGQLTTPLLPGQRFSTLLDLLAQIA